GLAARVTVGKEGRELRGIALARAEALHPAVRHRGQVRVRSAAQIRDECWQGCCEVLVLPLAEAMPRHVDRAAEAALVAVRGGGGGALGGAEQRSERSAATLVELALDGRPVAPREARRNPFAHERDRRRSSSRKTNFLILPDGVRAKSSTAWISS